MKKLIFASSFLLFCIAANAQVVLANTKWIGLVNAPSPIEVELSFSKDTFDIQYQGQSVEAMKYELNGDTLTVNKISGSSPCDDAGKATYKISIKDEKLLLTTLKDPCEMRAAAFTPEGYIKSKE